MKRDKREDLKQENIQEKIQDKKHVADKLSESEILPFVVNH